jgi:hypothetical protein
MQRIVEPEILDGLSADDPAAQRSRRDLQRVHLAMRTRTIVAQALNSLAIARRDTAPLRVLEIGAGDGSLMLGVAKSLSPQWPNVALTLLDRQPVVETETIDAYARAGWSATRLVVDIVDWVAAAPTEDPPARWDLIVANLFLHHFEEQQLAALLAAVAARSDHFFACEPRCAGLALVASHLVGALGVNAVTRADAVLSVHAGFRDQDLTSMWPVASGWRLREYPAGLFSHCFCAQALN